MFNPSYLIKSRHGIFYFRYPVRHKRVSISLQTRCPKEALRLAKALEYHSANLLSRLDWTRMKHAQIMALLKDYYATKLEEVKSRIDTEGQLTKQHVKSIE